MGLFDQRCIAAEDGCEEEMLFLVIVFKCHSLLVNKTQQRRRKGAEIGAEHQQRRKGKKTQHLFFKFPTQSGRIDRHKSSYRKTCASGHSFGQFRVHPRRQGVTIVDVAVIILVILIVCALYNRSKRK